MNHNMAVAFLLFTEFMRQPLFLMESFRSPFRRETRIMQGKPKCCGIAETHADSVRSALTGEVRHSREEGRSRCPNVAFVLQFFCDS